MKVENFLKNLKKEDIDLTNKLDNLSGNEISEELKEKISENSLLYKRVEDEVLKIAPFYKEAIEEETEKLMEMNIISENDYSSGLYNCDAIYVSAIIRSIGIDASSLRLCL